MTTHALEEPERLYLVRRTDGEPIDDHLFYMAPSWDEAVGVAGELISGDWGYGDGTKYEVLEVVVARGETFGEDEEE